VRYTHENVRLFVVLKTICKNVKEFQKGQFHLGGGEILEMGVSPPPPLTYISVSYLGKPLHSNITVFSMTYGFFFLTQPFTFLTAALHAKKSSGGPVDKSAKKSYLPSKLACPHSGA
jgi:hypothetical protein